MMQLTCPHCGPRGQSEFIFERTLDSVIPVLAAAEDAIAALFTRGNPRGDDEEIWRHTYGCRAWMVITRNRVTNVVSAIRAVGPEALP